MAASLMPTRVEHETLSIVQAAIDPAVTVTLSTEVSRIGKIRLRRWRGPRLPGRRANQDEKTIAT